MAFDARSPLPDVLQRIRGDFLEMPGLKLTLAQGQRLWGIDRTACEVALASLVSAEFLRQTREGAYMRRDALSA
jgi:hypothetical protein